MCACAALADGLRRRAAEVSCAADHSAELDAADLVGARRRRCVGQLARLLVVAACVVSVLGGAVHFHRWWVEGRFHAGVLYTEPDEEPR